MVDEAQRQRQTPLARIENPGSNAMDNYYGFGRGLDVRNPQDFQRQQQHKNLNNPHHPSHANRTIHTDDQGRMFRRNMRGKDYYGINVGPRPERDTTGLGGLINRLDTGNKGYTDILNAVTPDWDWLPGEYFNQDYKDWNDKYYGKADSDTGRMFNQSGISSERQPGLEEGIMGALPGEYETSGIYQQWKKIYGKFGETFANEWLAKQQAT
jgi:hypothetical protein